MSSWGGFQQQRGRALRNVGALGFFVLALVLVSACVRVEAQYPGAWQEAPSLEPQAGPEPSLESRAEPEGPQPPAPPRPCADPDPAVLASCLNPVGAIHVLPDGQSALVGEQQTGRILRVQKGSDPVEIARVPVDASGGGGLTGLALSSTYHEDELIYAYVSTGTEHQVLRVAPRDRAKPVLTGIPQLAGDAGAMMNDKTGALLIATAGTPQEASNPSSLAGKILRIDSLGRPAPGNPNPASPVVASGLTRPTGMCHAPGMGGFWVTEQDGSRQALRHVHIGQPAGPPVWTWPDAPGVNGCGATPNLVVVALTGQASMFALQPSPEGTIVGQPTVVMANTYGRFSAMAMGPGGLLWTGTSNKSGGKPVPTDDRVIVMRPPSAGATGRE